MEDLKALDSGNIRRDYVRFTLPTVLSLAVFSLYSTVDGIFVGRFLGPDAMASVNLGVPYMNFLFSVAVLLAVGASTIIASTLGEGDRSHADRLFSQNVAAAAAVGVALSLCTQAFLTPICRFLGAEGELLAGTRTYVGFLSPFAVFIMLEYNLEVMVKTDGHPRIAAAAVLCGGVVNILLDYLALAVFDMGIRGAALATGIAESVSALIFLGHFVLSRRRTLHFTTFSPEISIYKRLLPLGIPDGISELCVGVTTWLYNLRILHFFGSAGVAGFAITTSMNRIVFNLFLGTSQGMQPLVSYHSGRGSEHACRALLRCSLTAVTILAVLTFGGVFFFAGDIARLFLARADGAVWAESAAMLRIWCASFLVMGFNVAAIGYLTARESPWRAIVLSVSRGLALQAVCLFILSAVFGGSGIFWAPLLCEGLCVVMSVVFLRQSRGWKEKAELVIPQG